MFKITFNDYSYSVDIISPTELKVRKLPSITVGMKKVTPLARPRLDKQPTMAAQETQKFGIISLERLAKQGNDTKPKQATTESVKELLLEIGKQMGIQL